MLPAHPAADMFPMLGAAEFRELVADIVRHGQREPVKVWRGLVVDGRNREAACRAAGIEPVVEHLPEDMSDADIRRLVVSLNIHRRHLTAGQRAAIAGDLLEPLKAEAKERQREAARQTNEALGRDTLRTNCDEASPGDFDSADEAAKLTGSSRVAVYRDQALRRDAAPELHDEVRAGRLSQHAATEIARALPDPAEQVEVVTAARTLLEQDPEAVKQAARLMKEEAKARRDAKARAALEARAEAAREAAPETDGIDLRLCAVEDLVVDASLQGAVLVHADPPWAYDKGGRGAAGNHYATTDEMGGFVDALNRAYDLAADDAILLVWVTAPMLAGWARAVLDHELRWEEFTPGFWLKTHTGLGGVWRGQVELLCMYRKGNPKPFQREAFANVHQSGRTEHSEKPVAWLTELVAALAPEGGLVLDLYAGLAPLARACRATGRRYVGAEFDADRRAKALDLLAIASASEAA